MTRAAIDHGLTTAATYDRASATVGRMGTTSRDSGIQSPPAAATAPKWTATDTMSHRGHASSRRQARGTASATGPVRRKQASA